MVGNPFEEIAKYVGREDVDAYVVTNNEDMKLVGEKEGKLLLATHTRQAIK